MWIREGKYKKFTAVYAWSFSLKVLCVLVYVGIGVQVYAIYVVTIW